MRSKPRNGYRRRRSSSRDADRTSRANTRDDAPAPGMASLDGDSRLVFAHQSGQPQISVRRTHLGCPSRDLVASRSGQASSSRPDCGSRYGPACCIGRCRCNDERRSIGCSSTRRGMCTGRALAGDADTVRPGGLNRGQRWSGSASLRRRGDPAARCSNANSRGGPCAS
jgi:hypothetical protein